MNGQPRIPLLQLRAGSFAGLDMADPTDMYQTWSALSKCSRFVEHGQRFENLAWRLWNQPVGHPLSRIAPLDIPTGPSAPQPAMCLSSASESSMPGLSTSADSLSSTGDASITDGRPEPLKRTLSDRFHTLVASIAQSKDEPLFAGDLSQSHQLPFEPHRVLGSRTYILSHPGSLVASDAGSATVTPSPVAGRSPGRSSDSQPLSFPIVVPQSVLANAFPNNVSSVETSTSTSANTSTTFPTDVSIASVESTKSVGGSTKSTDGSTETALNSRASSHVTAIRHSSIPSTAPTPQKTQAPAAQKPVSPDVPLRTIRGFNPPPMSFFSNFNSRRPSPTAPAPIPEEEEPTKTAPSSPPRRLGAVFFGLSTEDEQNSPVGAPEGNVEVAPSTKKLLGPLGMSFYNYQDADVFSESEDEGNAGADEDDWEDEDEEEESGPSTSDGKQSKPALVFARVDSRPNLVSRPSLLTSMMNDGQRTDRFLKQATLAAGLNNGSSSRFSSLTGMSGPKLSGLSAHLQNHEMTDLARPLTPKTTRQSMVGNELPKELRDDLLRERTQIIAPVRRQDSYYELRRNGSERTGVIREGAEEADSEDEHASSVPTLGIGQFRRTNSSRRIHFQSMHNGVVW